MVLNDLVNSCCYSLKNARLKGLTDSLSSCIYTASLIMLHHAAVWCRYLTTASYNLSTLRRWVIWQKLNYFKRTIHGRSAPAKRRCTATMADTLCTFWILKICWSVLHISNLGFVEFCDIEFWTPNTSLTQATSTKFECSEFFLLSYKRVSTVIVTWPRKLDLLATFSLLNGTSGQGDWKTWLRH